MIEQHWDVGWLADRADQRRKEWKEHELLSNWLKGKKRTCPKCEKIFITRKEKRIHQKSAHKKYT